MRLLTGGADVSVYQKKHHVPEQSPLSQSTTRGPNTRRHCWMTSRILTTDNGRRSQKQPKQALVVKIAKFTLHIRKAHRPPHPVGVGLSGVGACPSGATATAKAPPQTGQNSRSAVPIRSIHHAAPVLSSRCNPVKRPKTAARRSFAVKTRPRSGACLTLPGRSCGFGGAVIRRCCGHLRRSREPIQPRQQHQPRQRPPCRNSPCTAIPRAMDGQRATNARRHIVLSY
jgi:hypothetical protein